MNGRLISVLWAVSLLLGAVAAPAAQGLQPINTDENGTAVKGYDTVAYFTEGKAVRGDNRFSTIWKGARWLFSNADHLTQFRNNPEKYAPQYGGY